MMNNIEERLIEYNLPQEVFDLVLSNIKVEEVKSFNISSPFSNYKYNEEQIEDDDHLWQLMDDIILSNLHKIKHVNSKLFDLKVGDSCWIVFISNTTVPQEIVITEVKQRVSIDSNKVIINEDITFITAEANKLQIKPKGGRFQNYKTSYNDVAIFSTREEAVVFFKNKFNLN